MIRTLIVEDEQIIRQGLVYTIQWENMGAEIVGEASTGQEGLEKIRSLKPDLVITDIRMPIMNGIDMVETALNDCDFETIILTSYSDFGYTKKSIQLQVFDYLLKPIEKEDLRVALLGVGKKLHDKRKREALLKQAGLNQLLSHISLNDIHDRTYSTYTKMALDYISEHYSEKISIEDAAFHMSISPSYLSRLFKKETTETFHYQLNKYRIKESIPLLLSGNYMIYEIAELVGISDYKQYNTIFKKFIGYAPSEFIQKLNERE